MCSVCQIKKLSDSHEESGQIMVWFLSHPLCLNIPHLNNFAVDVHITIGVAL
jgi:hypothetical protein